MPDQMPYPIAGLSRWYGIDVSYQDINVWNVDVESALYAKLQRMQLAPGHKTDIHDRKEFDEFYHFAMEEAGRLGSGITIAQSPGGSSSNTLVDMQLLINTVLAEQGRAERMSSVLQTAVDSTDPANQEIMEDYRQARITPLLPFEKEASAEAARSIIIYPKDSDGKTLDRIMVKFPGNLKDVFVTPSDLDAKAIEGSQGFLIQGSGWARLRDAAGESPIMDHIMRERWLSKKPLIVALPTDRKWAEANAEKVRWLMSSANYVLSNIEELVSTFKDKILSTHPEVARYDSIDKPLTVDERLAVEEQALNFLKTELELSIQNNAVHWQNAGHSFYPIAMITRGEDGAELVRPHQPHHHVDVDSKTLQERQTATGIHVMQKAGAGDSAYAGFISALILGQTPEEAIEWAMTVAATKLTVLGARITDVGAYSSEFMEKVRQAATRAFSI